MAQLLCLSKGGDGGLDLPSFPYDAVHSPDPDTSDDEDQDQDQFFAGLTRRLTQSKSFAGVPSRQLAMPPYPIAENHAVKATLTGPRTANWLTPARISQFQLESERFDLAVHAAALELMNLNMAPQEHPLGTYYSEKQASPFRLVPNKARQLASSQDRNHNPFSLPGFAHYTPERQRRHAVVEGEVVKQRHDALRRQQQQLQIQDQMRKLGFAEGSRFGRTHSFPQPGLASKVGPYGGGSGPKRGCAGTGVFLPRGYGDVATESRKRSGCPTPTVIVPDKVARALNSNAHLQDQGALLLARRNALLFQRRGGLRPDGSHLNHEPGLLPQEWTY